MISAYLIAGSVLFAGLVGILWLHQENRRRRAFDQRVRQVQKLEPREIVQLHRIK